MFTNTVASGGSKDLFITSKFSVLKRSSPLTNTLYAPDTYHSLFSGMPSYPPKEHLKISKISDKDLGVRRTQEVFLQGVLLCTRVTIGLVGDRSLSQLSLSDKREKKQELNIKKLKKKLRLCIDPVIQIWT